MLSAVGHCDAVLREDLPPHLKITSISTRLTNLRTQADTLLVTLGLAPPTPEHAHKGQRRRSRARRTESACASELAIKQLLATLQKSFADYKKAVERRTVSPQPRVTKPHPSTTRPHPSTSDDDKKAVIKNEKKCSDPSLLNVPVQRRRANTTEATKSKKKASAVLQRVEALNEKASNEDALLEFGTVFSSRARANTADTVGGVAKPELPRQRSPVNAAAELPRQRSPTSLNENVSLRKKVGRVNRTERRDKINAIRKIFEASNTDDTVPTVTINQSDVSSSGRGRLNTAPPAVVKAVLKEHTPQKQKVITITMETPATTELPDSTDLPVAKSHDTTPNFERLHSRLIRATRSVSPQSTNQILATPTDKLGSTDSSPVHRRGNKPHPLPLRASGKVSSLRDMFDSQVLTVAYIVPYSTGTHFSNFVIFAKFSALLIL